MNKASAPSWLDELCGWVALVGPILVGILAASGWSQWRDDLAVVRDLGVVPVGSEGVLSMVLAQLSSFIPIGGRLLRATWVSCLALGICGRLLYGMVRDALRAGDSDVRSPLVALLASALAVVSPIAQTEAARVGGVLPALALLLAGLLGLQAWRRSSDARLAPGLGLLTGVTVCESQASGGVLLLAGLAYWVTDPRRSARGEGLPFSCAFGFSTLLGSLFSWLRPLSDRAWLDLGAHNLATGGGQETPLATLGAGLASIGASAGASLGLVAASVGGLSLVASLANPAKRSACQTLFALVAFGCVQPIFVVAGHERSAGLSELSLAFGLVGCAAVGLQWGLRTLREAQLPYSGSVSPLVLVLSATLVLRGLDRVPMPKRVPQTGAEAWTEEALGKLPARSLLLVRREATAYRLLASRVLQGYRADVISVPTSLLGHGSFAQDLLAAEPELSSLLRQLAVHGHADEYSLSVLADARPLFVELDPQWDQRLLEHLRPEAMWLGFSAHALGPSDRKAGLLRSQKAFERVTAAVDNGQLETRTQEMLVWIAEQQALVLASLGDRKGASQALDVLEGLEPLAPVLIELRERLARRSRGRVAVADLIH